MNHVNFAGVPYNVGKKRVLSQSMYKALGKPKPYILTSREYDAWEQVCRSAKLDFLLLWQPRLCTNKDLKGKQGPRIDLVYDTEEGCVLTLKSGLAILLEASLTPQPVLEALYKKL